MIQIDSKYVNDIVMVESPTTEHKYEVLEDIYPTQYYTIVDTGVKLSKDISIECKYKCDTNHNSAYPRVFAGSGDWNTLGSIECYYHQGSLSVKFFGETSTFATLSQQISTDNNDHVVYMSSSEFIFDGNILATHTPIDIQSNYNLYICCHKSGYNLEQGYFPIYYFKVWDGNDLIRDMVPVKRLSDNKYGMYDYVNDQFYSSAGDQEFTGTSKSTPEYIDETVQQAIYINRIYLDGDIYWGGDTTSTPPTPPTPTHLLHGTTTATSNFNINLNNTQIEVTVDTNTGEFWLDYLPSNLGNVTSLEFCFAGNQNITSVDQINLDTSGVTNTHDMFGACNNLKTLDLSNIDVSHVTYLNGMFYNNYVLEYIDFSNWQLPSSSLATYDWCYGWQGSHERIFICNNVNENTFTTLKRAFSDYRAAPYSKIIRDGVTYVYRNNSWVVE